MASSMVWSAAMTLAVAVGVSAPAARAEGRLKTEIVPQVPHSLHVYSVAFSPDGKRVLSGSWDKTLKLWDLATGQLVRTLEGHTDNVFSVAFLDGKQVLSGGRDGKVKLWDAATGRLVRTFEGHSSSVNSVASSPDRKLVVSGSFDKTAKLWEAATGRLVHTFDGHDQGVTSIAFSPDGKLLLSGSYDKTVKLWNADTARLVHTFEGHANLVESVAFSPDGKQVLSGSRDSTVKLWDAATGQLIRTFFQRHNGLSGLVQSVAFSPDGKQVLSGGTDQTAKIWDASSGRLVRTFEASTGVYSVAFSPDGKRVLAGNHDKTVKLWEAATGQLVRTFGGQSGVHTAAFSPDGKRVLLGSADRTPKLWDAAAGRLVRTFEGHANVVTSLTFSLDGKHVLSGSRDGTAKVWNTATGQLVRTFERHAKAGYANDVISVAFSPDGKQVLSGGYDNTVKVWNAATGRLVRSLEGHSNSVISIAFSPDGKQVLSGSSDNTIKLWDAVSGQLLRTFTGLSGVATVAFSPDGKQVLTRSFGATAQLWDAASGQLLRSFGGYAHAVTSVAFSPNGKQVLTGSQDWTAKLWDAATGQLLRTFERHSGWITSVAFSPDGKQVLSGGSDTTTRIWRTETGELLATMNAAHDGEWLILTPQGFFNASSRKASELLAVVRGLDTYFVHQAWQSLFNPDLVREALAGDSRGEVKDAAEVINLEKVLDSGPAPEVAIPLQPNGHSASDLVRVEAKVLDKGRGVGRLEWRVNGVTVALTAKPDTAGPEYTLAQELALEPGDNVIEVVAYNGSNLLASLPARTTIAFTGTADAAKPTMHVLAIGINAYDDQGWTPAGQSDTYYFSPLKLAVTDAKAFGESMKRAAGGLYADVRLTTVTDEQATRENLGKVIDRIAAEVHPRDTFVMFAAAHGKSEAGRFYLIPQDYDGGPNPDALAKRAIDQSMLQDWLANRVKARRAVILLDTCESGALVSGHTRSRTNAPSSEAALGRLHEATGRPFLTAAAEGRPAFEGYEGHGVFTWALLNALRHGDGNSNGTIELSELVAHVQDQVPKIAAKLNGRGIAAIAVRGSTGDTQSARFGSQGEDFALTARLP